MNRPIALAAFAAGLIACGGAASATTPTLDTVTPIGPDYEYSYSGTIAGDEGLLAGSKLVILDFGDYVDGSVSSGIYGADLVASVELLTLDMFFAPGVIDDPLIPNLVFTWIGGPFNATGGPFPDVDFAGLSARSKNPLVKAAGYSALTTNNNGAATGTPVYTVGFVGVPKQTLGPPVPEPATWGLMLLGFGVVGLGLRRRPMVAVQFG